MGCRLLDMTKIGAALAASVMVLASLTACSDGESHEPVDLNIDSGVVVKRDRRHVTVREDDGETDKYTVSKSVSRKCAVGKRWPACKK
jgi:predicted secreted protein